MAAQKLIVSLLGFGLTLLARSAAAQAILDVAPPSGKDDTTNIQAALDACAAQGPSCTVQLQAGKAFVPSSPSRYFIHDNKFFATGQFA